MRKHQDLSSLIEQENLNKLVDKYTSVKNFVCNIN